MKVPSPAEWKAIVHRAKDFVRKHKATDTPEFQPGETKQIAMDICALVEFSIVLATELRSDFYKAGGANADTANRPLH